MGAALWIVVAISAAAAARYWSVAGRTAAVSGTGAAVLCLGAAAGIASVLWSVSLARPASSFEQHATPLAIAIAFDLSPSMLAIPDPALSGAAQPRWVRGRDVLLALLRGMEESGDAAVVAVVGFARRADVIMGWNRNLAEAGEVIRYTLSPEIFGASGSSMEAAANGIEDVFGMLPAAFADARRIAIVVSDGEDTVRRASLGYAVDSVASANADVIALQVGSQGVNEGVPVYDRDGDFTGFERMGGRLYTRPDAAVMEALAKAADEHGLLLHAEAADAAERTIAFARGDDAGRRGVDESLLPVLCMFGTVFLLTIWTIR